MTTRTIGPIAVALLAAFLVAPAGGQPAAKIKELEPVRGQISSLHPSPDGAYLAAVAVKVVDRDGAASGDGVQVVVWDLKSGATLFKTERTQLTSLAFTPDGKGLIQLGRGPALEGGVFVQKRALPGGDATEPVQLVAGKASAVLLPDGKSALIHSGSVKEPPAKLETWRLDPPGRTSTVDLDPIDLLYARPVAGGGYTAVYGAPGKGFSVAAVEAKSGKATRAALKELERPILSEDGKYVVGPVGEGLRAYDPAGKLKWSAPGPFGSLWVKTKGKHVMVAHRSVGKLTVLDLPTGKMVRQLDAGQNMIEAASVSPDGKTLYVAVGRGLQPTEHVVQVRPLLGK